MVEYKFGAKTYGRTINFIHTQRNYEDWTFDIDYCKIYPESGHTYLDSTIKNGEQCDNCFWCPGREEGYTHPKLWPKQENK